MSFIPAITLTFFNFSTSISELNREYGMATAVIYKLIKAIIAKEYQTIKNVSYNLK